jgi:hypothetical protein
MREQRHRDERGYDRRQREPTKDENDNVAHVFDPWRSYANL